MENSVKRKGHPQSDEARKKISESMKNRFKNMNNEEREEFSRKSSEANKKYWASLSKEERKKRLEKSINSKKSNKGKSRALKKYYSEMSKADKVEKLNAWIKSGQKASKEKWDSLTEEQRKKRLNSIIRKETKIEKVVEEHLIANNIRYKKQFYRKCKDMKRGFFFDFYLPDYKLVIECNGSYWHNLPSMVERDKLKEKFILSKGKKILWLWEDEINKDNFNVMDSLSKFKEIGGREFDE